MGSGFVFFNVVNIVVDVEFKILEQCNKSVEIVLSGFFDVVVGQDEQVNVGVRVQFVVVIVVYCN